MRKQLIKTLSRGQSFQDSLQNTFFITTMMYIVQFCDTFTI